jgi:hypothetical protein
MPGPEETLFPKIQGRPTDINIETPRSQVIGEHSRYDPNYYIPIGGLSAQEIQTTRAENQGAWMELGTAAANLIPNTALSIVESAAHLADLEDWSNMIQGNAANYGNVLTEWAGRNKNVFGEVYRKDPQAGFDITDSAWWISNGAGLVESVVAFGLTGYGVGSVLGKGASALSKSLNAYGKAKMGLDLAAQVGTSGALAFTEGAMTGAQVFESEFPRLKQLKAEELLNQGIKQYGAENITEEYLKYVDEQSNNYANQLAGESATKAVIINTGINTFLNFPETKALFRSMSANRYLDDALRINRGENIDNYLERINSFNATKHLTREGIKSKVKQMGGETLEEMVNVYAEQEGRNVSRKARGEDIVTLADMLADDDIWAAGFWGAVGGSMQGFVMNKMPKSVVQEDGTTKWTTVGAYNKEQVVNKYEEQIGDLKDRLTEYIGAKNDLIKASQTNDQKLYNEAINKIFNYNSFNSIVKGVEEQLIGEYENIKSLSSEEAAQQGFKGDYRQDAVKKIQSVREYTSEWNKIQDRYMSQDLDMAGYPETIFQQFVNVENNKNIITEQEFEINKLQSDINQSYALKGTDLTIAAYNDIVSSIKALENDFDLEAIDLENLMNLDTFDSKTKKRIIAKLNNKYGNLENAKTQIEKNLENIREKARSFQKTFELQRENFDIQVDPENKLSQEEKDQMFARILAENEFEINALTEAKSQLQRNRETLRAQEDELRQLKSKDGVQKFKDLKKQKLAEQDQNTQTEIIQEQQEQAEAEREQRQEVINDIRTRQEEAPETITPEEAITLEELERAEQEELGVQGETYQEGGYTGEGSKPEELRQQYEDISKSANNTDEKGKVVDQNNNPIFVDDKLIFSFDKIAYASTIEYSEDEVSGKIKHTSLQLNPETNPDFLTTKFMPGTPIKLKKLDSNDFKEYPAPKRIAFKDEFGREVFVANAGETVTFGMLSHPYMQPIGIYDADNKVIGMLHDVTYIRPSRVLQQSLEDDRNNLIALRSKIGDTFIETTINGKTNGHINQLRDGFRKLNELIQSPIEFAIATSSIQLNTSKTVIVDGLINKPNYKVGQVYAITYTPNGQKIAIPVKTTQVKEHTNVMNELLATFDKFAEGKISQNDLKETFSKYIYSTPTSEKLDAKGKNFKREPDGKDRFYIDFDSLNVNGIVFGKSGDSKKFLSVNTPKDQIEGLRRAFIDILSNSYININFEKLKDTNFVKEFATSNVRFYSLPDGRVTVFDNPVISIGTSFAGEIKPIEKTQEQPRVSPEIISDEVYNNFIDNNIVPDDILNDIANKIINKVDLSTRETSIFSGKTSEINEIIRQQVPSQPEVTPTTPVSDKEADIERRRQKTINEIYETKILENEDSTPRLVANLELKDKDGNVKYEQINVYDNTEKKILLDRVNAKYDAELESLKKKETPIIDPKADIEKRRQEELNQLIDLKPNKIGKVHVDIGGGKFELQEFKVSANRKVVFNGQKTDTDLDTITNEINAKYDAELDALEGTTITEPTIEPPIEIKPFTSNNGIEFTPGLDEDDLLPTITDSEKQIEKSLSLQNKVLNLINEGKITKFCK